MINSLLCVQGPIQLISAMCALQYQSENELADRNCYLCFFDLGGDEDIIYPQLMKLIQNVNFSNVFYINENKINKWYKLGRCFAIKKLKKELHNISFDELYMAFLGTYSTSLFGNAYKKSRKICYGDSFGVVGNDWFLKRKITGIKEFVKSIFFEFDNKGIKFNSQILILPELMGNKSFKKLQLNVPSRELVLSVIHKCLETLDLSELNIESNSYCILLPSNLHQAGLLSEKNELLMYKDIMDKIPNDLTIFVKPHPRMPIDFFENSIFANKNITVLSSKFSKLPIEFFENFVRKAKFIVPLYSTSQQNLTYLYDIKIKQLLDDECVDKYFYPEKRILAKDVLKTNATVAKNLLDWNHKDFLN